MKYLFDYTIETSISRNDVTVWEHMKNVKFLIQSGVTERLKEKRLTTVAEIGTPIVNFNTVRNRHSISVHVAERKKLCPLNKTFGMNEIHELKRRLRHCDVYTYQTFFFFLTLKQKLSFTGGVQYALKLKQIILKSSKKSERKENGAPPGRPESRHNFVLDRRRPVRESPANRQSGRQCCQTDNCDCLRIAKNITP